jgi:hypothetical protein
MRSCIPKQQFINQLKDSTPLLEEEILAEQNLRQKVGR